MRFRFAQEWENSRVGCPCPFTKATQVLWYMADGGEWMRENVMWMVHWNVSKSLNYTSRLFIGVRFVSWVWMRKDCQQHKTSKKMNVFICIGRVIHFQDGRGEFTYELFSWLFRRRRKLKNVCTAVTKRTECYYQVQLFSSEKGYSFGICAFSSVFLLSTVCIIYYSHGGYWKAELRFSKLHLVAWGKSPNV